MAEQIRTEFLGNIRTDFMVGTEVEKTPAYGKLTLFVQGYKTYEEILNKSLAQNINHIYLGANRSFTTGPGWSLLIAELLDNGFFVTLDYVVAYHKQMMHDLPLDIWQHKNFIPMITVDISNLCGLSQNLTVKIDDIDFVSKGVWCLNQSEIADSDKFTSWDQYADDKIIE